MQQFDYTQAIPRHLVVSAPPTLTRRQMDEMFDDYESHLVPEEAQSTIAPSDWSYVDGYIRWFFRVSHLYMVQAPPRDSPKPTHQEILEETQAQLDHVECVLPIFRRIVEIARADIDKGIFLDRSNVRQVLDVIVTEARGAWCTRDIIRGRGRLMAEEANEIDEAETM